MHKPLHFIQSYAKGNSHIYYLVVKDLEFRTKLIDLLKGEGILTVSHYVALHSSPFGRQFSIQVDESDYFNCDKFSQRLIRFPLYHELTVEDVEFIALKVLEAMKKI